MPGIGQGVGLIPPLQLSFGSSAPSSAKGGSLGGGGMGALNEGDWIVQTTGTGNNSAVPAPKPAAASNTLMVGLLGLGALWIFLNKSR